VLIVNHALFFSDLPCGGEVQACFPTTTS
jgi:hypothetical protein